MILLNEQDGCGGKITSPEKTGDNQMKHYESTTRQNSAVKAYAQLGSHNTQIVQDRFPFQCYTNLGSRFSPQNTPVHIVLASPASTFEKIGTNISKTSLKM